MPITDHIERHATRGRDIRDIVLGMSDGLTVPFALVAGVAGAMFSAHAVLTTGVAEIVAGSVSMGLGGYLAARTEADHYRSERDRESRETHELPQREVAEVHDVFINFGFSERLAAEATAAIIIDRERWIDFMMRFELDLEKPPDGVAARSACFVGGGYALGGVFPLAPYAFFTATREALTVSCLTTGIALVTLGVWKARMFRTSPWAGAATSAGIGAVAAAAAYLLARATGV